MRDKILLREALRAKKRAPKRAGAVKPPVAQEVAYAKDLRKVVEEILDAYKAILIPKLKSIAGNITEAIPARLDAGEGELFSTLGRVRLVIGQKVSDDELRRVARRNLGKVEDYNSKSTKRQVKRVTGVDIIAGNPQVESTVVLSTANNVSLIKGLAEDAITRVEQTVYEGFRTGLRWESIAADIEEQLDPDDGPVASRARRIARDQVSKLNGQLTEARQTGLGITHYFWRTSGVERVRDSHAAKEGNRYAWDDPPADTGHPGEDINCLVSGSLATLTHGPRRGFKRFYTGKVVKITIESGVSVTVTPNHPVLTSRGWVAAKNVDPSDKLFKCLNPKMANFLDAEVNNNPTSADDIFDLLSVSGSTQRARGVDVQFHADGSDSDVNVVNAPSGLGFRLKSGLLEKLEYLGFSDPNLALRSLLGYCAGLKGGNFSGLAPDGVMRTLRLAGPGLGIHERPLELFGFGRTSDFNAAFKQSGSDYVPAGLEVLRDVILAEPGLVESNDLADVEVFSVPGTLALFGLCNIVDVSHEIYSGFVFNFETTSGFYLASDVIVHNCRCTAEPDLSTVVEE